MVKVPEERQTVILDIDIPVVRELKEAFETLRASVWENSELRERTQVQIDSLRKANTDKFNALKEQINRLELSLTPIFEFSKEWFAAQKHKRERDARIDDLMAKVENLLNP